MQFIGIRRSGSQTHVAKSSKSEQIQFLLYNPVTNLLHVGKNQLYGAIVN